MVECHSTLYLGFYDEFISIGEFLTSNKIYSKVNFEIIAEYLMFNTLYLSK